MIAAVLECELDNESYEIVMDTINDNTISSTNTITEQPLLNGDFIADHMFRKPISYSLSGEFGLGSKQGIVVNNGKLQLTEIETLFERIKNEGVVCTIVKVSTNDENPKEFPRFLKRDNLILESISWTERVNTLGFSFSFREIAFAESIEYDVDIDDAFLPNVTAPRQASFSSTLLDQQALVETVLTVMYKEGILTTEFIKAMGQNKEQWAIAVVGSVAAGFATVYALVVSTSVVSGPVGWIIGAAVTLTMTIGYIIWRGVEANKYKVKPFEKYSDKEVERFQNLMKQIVNGVAELSDGLRVYQITSNDDQECILTIDDSYFVFNFKKHNEDQKRYLLVTDNEVKPVGEGLYLLSSCLNNYGDATSTNAIYKNDDNKLYVHCIYSGDNTDEEKDKYINYNIVITTGFKPEDFSKMVGEAIRDYLLK